jgi:hypothetical protein
MRIKISGGRGDLTEWPDPGVPFWVDDAEGAQLCAGGMAYPVAEEPLTEVRSDPDPEPEPVVTGGKPKTIAPKSDWVDHAVAQGADRAEAEAMKKADLIAAYNGNGNGA